MSTEQQQMREIARDETWLRRFDSPTPSEGTMVRLKAEVRLATNEAWLGKMDGPGPSVALKVKVRGAIREALSWQADPMAEPVAIRMGSPAWHRTVGALSAAALVGISVGIARFSPGPVPEPLAVVPVVVKEWTLLAEVDEAIQEIRYELSALESGSNGTESWREYEDDDEPLEGIYEALESLMDDIEGGPETS
jgi:hypothetical protein